MRFYIVFALITYLVALVYATPTPAPAPFDYVYLSNYGLKFTNKVYNKSKPVCINVDKAFSGKATFIITRGRVVDLYAGANCTNLVRTTKPNDGDYYGFWQPLMSFKVRAK
ncbi:hypothetical protein GGI17_002297 [Coemansia sp. S146]|nr:hypothetical protein GGI17_002297 [Coemansia sp. S146]